MNKKSMRECIIESLEEQRRERKNLEENIKHAYLRKYSYLQNVIMNCILDDMKKYNMDKKKELTILIGDNIITDEFKSKNYDISSKKLYVSLIKKVLQFNDIKADVRLNHSGEIIVISIDFDQFK